MNDKNISLEEKEGLEKIYNYYLNHPKIQEMKEISMHRGSNCYIHSFLVAKLAIKRALKWKNLNLEIILIASILHDYYLYDWRKNRELLKKHASRHPFIAASNAKRDFNISDDVAKIIETHMWPYNFSMYPSTREARIVANADTWVAMREALMSKKEKIKKDYKNISLKQIEHLF